MNLEELIKPDNILCNVSARSKKHCLEILSELLTRFNPGHCERRGIRRNSSNANDWDVPVWTRVWPSRIVGSVA